MTEREVLENNYDNNSIIATRPAERNLKWFTNAHVLVYFRESEIDEIFSPVVLKDIPSHLRTYMLHF